ncbi:Multidrug resistance protein MdtH [Propionibacterium australiense]|uniref:MFS n=2 Tax=Propionibacterium australiense TaxID=119981 RepID=A0A383S4X2_9ACTN|nr:MFS transporter [Propionibacterium australiense]RLP08328.1 MFS transporter [Propionibacterium australiense]SYZ33050.1 MFS [Propionibacterium australiense]VEH89021.1 Multidrug resistance protein MdtH [Propionibacterium australiense]
MPRGVIILGVIALFVGLGFGVIVPVLPLFAGSFQANDFMVGVVVSAFAAVRLATSPFSSQVMTRIGARTTLGVGLLLVAVSSALMGIARSYWWLLGWRAVGGVGSALFTVSSMTVLLAVVPETMRGRATGFYQSGFLIGSMAGPAVGGLLAGISLQAPFEFYALTLLVASVLGLVLLPRTLTGPDAAGDQAPQGAPMRRVLRDSRYQAALVANFAQGWNSTGVRNALIPLVITVGLGLSATWTGTVFAIAAVIQTVAVIPVGRFVDTVGRRPAMLAGSLVMAASLMAVPLSGSIGMVIAAMCVYAVGAAAMSTAPAASVGDATGGVQGGTAVAVFSMCNDGGAIVGPLVAGAVSDAFGRAPAFAVGVAFLLVSALVAVRMSPMSATRTPRNRTV